MCCVCREKVAPGCFIPTQEASSCCMSFVPHTGPSLYSPPFILFSLCFLLSPILLSFSFLSHLASLTFYPHTNSYTVLSPSSHVPSFLKLPYSAILTLLTFFLFFFFHLLLSPSPYTFFLPLICMTFLFPTFPLTAFPYLFSSLVSSLVAGKGRHDQGRQGWPVGTLARCGGSPG